MQEIKEHFIDKFCGKTEDGGLFLEPIYLAMPLELFNWIATEVSHLEPQFKPANGDIIKMIDGMITCKVPGEYSSSFISGYHKALLDIKSRLSV